MRRLLLIVFLLVLSNFGHGQTTGAGFIIYVSSAPSGTCSAGAYQENVIGLGTVYTCQSGTWTQLGGSGSVAFSAITGATNSTAAMIIGTGASLTVSGSGTNTATGLTGSPAITVSSCTGCGGTSASGFHIHDDFCGGVTGVTAQQNGLGETSWTAYGNGQSGKDGSDFNANHPCLIALLSGGNSTDFEYMYQGVGSPIGSGGNGPVKLGTSSFDFIFNVRPMTSGSAFSDILVGLFLENDQAIPASGAYFESLNAANWKCVTRNASTQTSTDSGIAATNTSYYALEVISTASSTVTFKINGTQVCSQSTNVDTTHTLIYGVASTNAAGGGTTETLIDYADLTMTPTRN